MIGSRSLECLYRPSVLRERKSAPWPWLAVLTCMDPRVHPQRALGVEPAATYVLRNAGGRVTDDVVRSLVFAWSARGVNEFAVMHHADCGLRHTTDDEVRRRVETALDVDASGMHFGAFEDVDRSVTTDVQALRDVRTIPADIPITGFVFDDATGRLRTVIRDPASRLPQRHRSTAHAKERSIP